jgi:hypothetical protein
MIWFVTGLVIGALLSVPVIPLLRATDPVFGRAAAVFGFAAAVAIVGIFVWRRA